MAAISADLMAKTAGTTLTRMQAAGMDLVAPDAALRAMAATNAGLQPTVAPPGEAVGVVVVAIMIRTPRRNSTTLSEQRGGGQSGQKGWEGLEHPTKVASLGRAARPTSGTATCRPSRCVLTPLW